MVRNVVFAALVVTMVLAGGCKREGKPKDKIDELPRGTGGTPATQVTTRPAS